jgi:sporulation protein YlmC with PRC-barrel domain
MTGTTVVRLEDLLGRRVVAANGRPVGRIEEIRAERRGGEYEVVEYLVGTRAVLERWSVVQDLFGMKGRKLVARWNQVDISDPRGPRLTCPLAEVEFDDGETR